MSNRLRSPLKLRKAVLAKAVAPVVAHVENLETRRMFCQLGVSEPGPHLHLSETLAAIGAHEGLAPDSGPMGPQRATKSDTSTAKTAAIAGPDPVLQAAPTPAPTGALTGKIVYMNGGHGWTWSAANGSWSTQRGDNNEMVEDFQTQDQITYYAQYLLNSGATVVATRPLGHQLNEVIVDNHDAGFSTPLGSWGTNTSASTYWSNTGGTDTTDRYRTATPNAASETQTARFTPTITTAGVYPVYAWWNNGSNRSTGVTYRINSGGGSQEVKVNQRYTGKGWVYLGQYYFDAGTTGNVEVSNKASDGSAIIADAVRFGNGMGDWHGDGNAANPVSGRPREEELSLYWALRSRGYTASGTIDSAASTAADNQALDSDSGIGTPPRWAAYMNDSSQGANTDRVFISFHSNAFDTTAQGTVALTDKANPTPNQNWWANEVGNEVEEDLQLLPTEHPWASRGNTLDGAYGEISASGEGTEFATTLLEVAFHDNVNDAENMRDPKVRDWVARAAYQSTVKYFATNFGVTPPVTGSYTLLPDPPTNIRTTTNAANGNVVLNWSAPGTGSANGGAGAATGYKIYTSSNGYSWSDVIVVGNVLTTTITGLPTNAMTYFKVVATNAGGESLQREVVVGKPQTGSRASVLIVNGYDRLDRFQDDTVAYSGGNGTTTRVRLRYQNTRDYTVQYAEAIEAFNSSIGVETAQNDQVISGTVNLGNYHTVLWISGEESTADDTYNATEQSLVTTFINNGGHFLASGSELGFDLDASGNGATFYNTALHADYVADDAGTYTTAGVAGSAFAGISSIVFDNGASEGASGTYDVDTPDTLAISNGSTSALTYTGGAIAAVQWASGTNSAKVITMGFPFETITTSAKRNSVMAGVLTYFGTASAGISATPGAPDLLPATDSGFNNDNRTYYNNSAPAKALQFQVTGTVVGATVTIYNGAAAIGSAVATGSTTTVTCTANVSGVNTLPDGAKTITAKQTETGKPESAASASLSVTIDATPAAAPAAATVTTTSSSATLDWPDVVASDMFGYNIYRSSTNGGPYTLLNTSAPFTASTYTDSTLSPGTYYYVVRSVDTAFNESANGPQATAVVATPGSATPGVPDLDATLETGTSNTDNITSNNNSLSFTVGSTIAGANIKIYIDGVFAASAIASGTSTTVTTSATPIADGPHNITATQTETAQTESAASAPLGITIDTQAPTVDILDVSPDPRSTSVASIGVDFSEAIAGVVQGDLSLTRNGGSNLLTGTQTFTSGNSTNFTLNNLAAVTSAGGSYSLTLTTNAGITDVAGNALAAGASDAWDKDLLAGDATPNANDTFRLEPVDVTTINVFINNNTATPDYVWTVAPGDEVTLNGGGGNDTLTVTAPLAVNVMFNGGTQSGGGDALEVIGDGIIDGSYTPGAITGDGVVVAGAHQVAFIGLEPVTVSDFDGFSLITPNAADVITIDSPAAGTNRVSGTSGGTAFESLSFKDVAGFTLNTGTNDGAGTDDTVTIAATGLVATGLTNFVFAGAGGNDTLNVDGGTVALNADASTTTTNLTLNVAAGATVNFNATQHLKDLNLNGGVAALAAGGPKVLVVDTITASNSGALDLADNDLIVRNMTLAQVEPLVASGFGDFDWLGSGIRSSAAAATAQTDASTAIGVLDNAEWGYGDFSGQPLSGNEILVKYTWNGDANLDGLVDGDDFNKFLDGFNGGLPGTFAPIWFNGDFDFNGVVDGDDFNSFVNGLTAFNNSGQTQL